MTYEESWSTTAQLFADSEWISVRNLRAVLRHMDSIKFALETNRQAALEFFAGYRTDAPFSHVKRFPAYEGYVRLSEGDWPVKIRQMVTALQFKMPTERKETVQVPTGRERQQPQQQQQPQDEPRDYIPNDVLLSFTTSIQSMRAQIGRGEGVYDRESLEHELKLEWVDSLQPRLHHNREDVLERLIGQLQDKFAERLDSESEVSDESRPVVGVSQKGKAPASSSKPMS